MRWAQHYDLRADDMLKFQDEVAQKVVEGLARPGFRTGSSNRSRQSLRHPLKPTICICRRDSTRTNTSCGRRPESLHQGQRGFTASHSLGSVVCRRLRPYWHISTPLESANVTENGAQNLALAEKTARRSLELKPDLTGRKSFAWAGYCTETGRNMEAIRIIAAGSDTSAQLGVGMGPTRLHLSLCRDWTMLRRRLTAAA